MVTIETLQIINVDLDAEMDERLNVQSCRINSQSKNVKAESLAVSIAVAAEEQEEDENVPGPDRRNTDHMRACDSLKHLYNQINRIFGIVLDYEWKWYKTILMYFPIAILVLLWICIPYTVCVHFRSKEYVRMMEPLVILGLAVSSTEKLAHIILYFKKMMSLHFVFERICLRTAARCSRGKIITKGYADMVQSMKIFGGGLMFGSSFYILYPMKVYVFDHKFITLIPMKIIFCDENTTLGFAITVHIQAVMGIYCAWATMLYGLSVISFFTYYKMLGNLLVEDFNDLDRMWTGEKKVSLQYRHVYLVNICKKRQDMNLYLESLTSMYKYKLMIYFIFAYVNQVISLYEVLVNNWYGGAGPCIGLFYEMLIYCYLGTQVSVTDDHLCTVIYNTKWYEYDLISQRTVMVLLREAQVSKELKLGFVGPLNLLTFIKIIKSIYSYYTILTEIL